MAKSIRSKIKRKHRAEFRRTIGTDAHNKSMAIVQSNLKETVKKGTMTSFDRIANMLDTDGDDTIVVDTEVSESPTAVPTGQNKAPLKKRRSAKRKLNAKRNDAATPVTKKHLSKEKPKPRYFCEF